MFMTIEDDTVIPSAYISNLSWAIRQLILTYNIKFDENHYGLKEVIDNFLIDADGG